MRTKNEPLARFFEGLANVLLLILSAVLVLLIAAHVSAEPISFSILPDEPPASFSMMPESDAPPESWSIMPDVADAPAAKPVIWCYCWPRGCPAGEKLKAAAKTQTRFDFQFKHQPKTRPCPVLVWRDNGGVHRQEGFTDLAAFEAAFDKSQLVNCKPAAMAPVRHPGTTWTHPGDLRQHLIQNHGFTAERLRGLSYQQMRTLHDNAHNGYRSSSACPGGKCPSPRAGAVRFARAEIKAGRGGPGLLVRVAHWIAIEFPTLTFQQIMAVIGVVFDLLLLA